MKQIYVTTTDGTTGFIDDYSVEYDEIEDLVGEKLNIHFHDENGNPMESIKTIDAVDYTRSY